jgi:hypothetical protein
MLQAHDPGRFERVLRQRISHPLNVEILFMVKRLIVCQIARQSTKNLVT